MEHARFVQKNINEQIAVLNKKTIEMISPDVITEIKQQYSYLKEISEQPTQMDRPMNVNRAGRNTLPSFTSVMGF